MCDTAGEYKNLRLIRVLALAAALIGVGARLYLFDRVPAGLNQDEVSIGYETWSLLHYGMDRNGFRWPVHFMSWGDGQNALYAYISLPFVTFGLSSFTVRLPMLLAALASLPLVWISVRELAGEKYAWCALGAVALSPWHIMLSRWALESNLLPAVFIGGLACLCMARRSIFKVAWLLFACTAFAVCMYAYGTAYLVVPVFLLGALALSVSEGTTSLRLAMIGVITFSIIAVPIGLYILVNFLKWDTLSIAGLTIPRLPSSPRFQAVTSNSPYLKNTEEFFEMLVSQTDGRNYNVTDPYGIIYSDAFLLVAIGWIVTTVYYSFRRRRSIGKLILVWWVLVTIPLGIVLIPNMNRVNILLMAVVVIVGVGVAELDNYLRGVAAITLTILMACCAFFLNSYFVEQRDDPSFVTGILPALQYARTNYPPGAQICVTDQILVPYIYALFTEQENPKEYLRTVRYDRTSPPWNVIGFSRYTFGLQRCDFRTARVAISTRDETIPASFRFDRVFDSIYVYTRRANAASPEPVSASSR